MVCRVKRFPMTTQSLLKVMTWLFLFAGVAGLAVSGSQYLRGASLADYGVMAIGSTFWLLCSAIAFFLRSRLA